MIAEYLYLDRARIDAYFQQFSSPLKREKIPVWKVALGLTGPSAEATQTQSTRPFTDHEKLLSLVNMLAPGADEGDRNCNFGLQTFSTRRAYLPASLSNRASFEGLAIWVCWVTGTPAYSYLIEDFPRDDDDRRNWSGNTALYMLFRELSEEIQKTNVVVSSDTEAADSWDFSVDGDFHSRLHRSDVLTECFHKGDVPIKEPVSVKTCGLRTNGGTYEIGSAHMRFNVFISADTTNSGRSRVTVRRDRRQELAARFATEPFELLGEWSAEIGHERKVDTLFRIRHTLIESSTIGSQRALIGYPIVIAEHPSPLIDN